MNRACCYLRTPAAIRERCGQILSLAEADQLLHFRYRPERLRATTDLVVAVIRANYPDLRVPYHSRWQHFDVGGVPRLARLCRLLQPLPALERGRCLFDLVITSVLLDAGAGATWSFQEAQSGRRYSRSEGLAVAGFHLFVDGLLSADPGQPLRADGETLQHLDGAQLARALQVGPDNPLVGVEGRVTLINQLGEAVLAQPRFFAPDPSGQARPGGLFDYFAGLAEDKPLPAARILETLLEALGPIWPGRLSLNGCNLGDCWRHPLVRADDESDGLVPFHKLSQWLTYSLLEPLEEYGLCVTGLEQLTGLAEYRNGGLLMDSGLIELKDPKAAQQAHMPDAPLIVEWRALTVALLDRIAAEVRGQLNLSAAQFPLVKVLQGGTWQAGRQIAREKRADGGPPLHLASDGTVF